MEWIGIECKMLWSDQVQKVNRMNEMKLFRIDWDMKYIVVLKF